MFIGLFLLLISFKLLSYNSIDYRFVTYYICSLFELKKIKNLWHFNGDIASLNYAHPLVKCLGANMVNQELKNTFNTLIDTKTFKDRVFLALLKRDPTAIRKDVGLSTYLALDTFYARILTLDFTNLEELQQINANRYFEKQMSPNQMHPWGSE